MIKILHTADWHLGKMLYKYALNEDIILFFDWLEAYIITEKIDVLLVSGDIFDLANPASRDIKLYYNFLHRLSLTGVKTIITGGNHDSVSLLNAPATLLTSLNISVIGGVPEDFYNQLIPIENKNKEIVAVVLAVPFLRDHELRASVAADQIEDKMDVIPRAIRRHYDLLVVEARLRYGQVPLIAMGHLFMRGALTSDSEREIHVGNLMGIDSQCIPEQIGYTALGHIHKPQKVDKNEFIRYSGSPIYLDFSESMYEKMVVRVELSENRVEVHPVPIPKFRELLRLKGKLDEITTQLIQYKNPYPLKTLVEAEVIDKAFDATIIHEAQSLESIQSETYQVIKTRISFLDQREGNDSRTEMDDHIENLDPWQIFDIRMETEHMEEQSRQALKIAYLHILESLNE